MLVQQAEQSLRDTVDQAREKKERSQFQSTTKSVRAKQQCYTPIVSQPKALPADWEGKVVLSHAYQIHKSLLTDDDIKLTKKYLTVLPKNAHAFSAGGHMTADSAQFAMYRETKDSLIVPRFYGVSRWGMPKNNRLAEGLPIKLETTMQLFDTVQYPQLKVFNQLMAVLDGGIGGSIAQLYTAFGKTVLSLELVKTLGRKTLFVADKSHLIHQARKEYTQFAPGIRTGIIKGNTNVDVEDKDVVFTTFQTMVQSELPREFWDQFGTVVIDECHHTAAQTFSTIFCKLRPKYIVALSATPDRKDGLRCVLHWLMGPVGAEERRPPMDVRVKILSYRNPKTQRELVCFRGPRTGQPDYVKMMSKLCADHKRNVCICNEVLALLAEPNRKIVVVSHRKLHLTTLMNMLMSAVESQTRCQFETEGNNVQSTQVQDQTLKFGFYTGDYKTEELLAALECNVVFASVAMMNEGVNDKRLDSIIYATPLGDITQSIGRILRKMAGKNVPKAVYLNDGFSLWANQAKKAISLFQGEGYSLTYVE